MASLAQQRTWQISDTLFNPFKLSHTETIYTTGNGYMGLRGTFEEGYPGEIVSTLVHGVYNHAEGELVPDLVNFPNPLPFIIEVDGEAFHMTTGKVLGFQRVLDLQRAILTREVLWRNSKGTIVKIAFERLVSLDLEHLVLQRISVRPLTGPCALRVTTQIDGTQTNEGVNHWKSLETGTEGTNRIYVAGTTTQSGYSGAVMSALVASPILPITPVPHSKRPGLVMETIVAKEQLFTFTKYSAIHSSRDNTHPLPAASKTLDEAMARGYDSLVNAHVAEWAKYWTDSDIEIEGDEPAQRAIRFTTYHILIAAPRHDDRVSIGAKTLSGPGYKGHVFWDTELFMVPMLTVTQPKLARNLLMYRYHNLAGARHKAQKNGYEGAMYPWESTDTGEETTPQWTNPLPDGTRLRIWTGDTEQHISTDIAYAVLQHWHWTGDDDWFARYGAEIFLDTAVFWGSRVEYKVAFDLYELPMQIGPDEYHENINNSAFTNSMVRWHLKTALDVVDWVQQKNPQLLTQLNIDTKRLSRWKDIVAKLYIPHDEKRGVIEQFDGFFDLEPLNLSLWQPRVMNMDAIQGHALTQRTMVIKQADIVMLMALLGDAFGTLDEQRKHWDVYYPIVDHGSSLSPSTHAWVAARLGLLEEAYKMFMFAGNIDMEDLKGNVRDGIHAAASGGLWEAATFGFAGLKVDPKAGKFDVSPHLPEHWRALRFKVRFRGESYTIELKNAGS